MAARKRDTRHEDDDRTDVPGSSDAGPTGVSNRAVADAVGRSGEVPYRSEMESAFGTDFGDVRAKTDAGALAPMGASASTDRGTVTFADRDPDRSTVAHEMAHVVQQRSGVSGTGVSDPGSSAEREASSVAERVGAGQSVDVRQVADAPVQRAFTDEIARMPVIAGHVFQQARIYAILAAARSITPDPEKGIHDRDNLLHNSAEWIVHNNADFLVLSPTHDGETRDPPEVATFDPTVKWPAAGGTYPADPTQQSSPHLEYVDADDLGGMTVDGVELSIVDPASQSNLLIIETIIHEVQHDADQSYPGLRWAESPHEEFADYQSEFRAYWIENPEGSPEDDFASSADSATNTKMVEFEDPASGVITFAETDFKNLRQEEIFWHLVDSGYDYVPRAYCQMTGFAEMVDAMASPTGGNLVNSVRIQTLSERLDDCDQSMWVDDPAVEAVLVAAEALDELDRAYLEDEAMSKAFWSQLDAAVGSHVRTVVESVIRHGTRYPLGDYPAPDEDSAWV